VLFFLCLRSDQDGYVSHRGDTAQVLARWRHPLASSSGARDVLGPLGDVPRIEPAESTWWRLKLPAIDLHFSLSLISIIPTNIDKDHVMVNIK
jgi:hypothetical protein